MADLIPTAKPIPGTASYWQPPRAAKPDTIVEQHNREAEIPRQRDVRQVAYQDWKPD